MSRRLLVAAVLALAGCGDDETEERPRAAEKRATSYFVEAPRKITSDTPLAVFTVIANRIDFDREAEELARMTRGQRALYTLTGVTGEIDNGGFSQLYWNSTGDLADEALAGARLVAARPYERLLREAAALFPGGRVPAERARRQELVESGAVPETRLSALDDRWFAAEEQKPLDDYLAAYMRAHPAEFFS